MNYSKWGTKFATEFPGTGIRYLSWYDLILKPLFTLPTEHLLQVSIAELLSADTHPRLCFAPDPLWSPDGTADAFCDVVNVFEAKNIGIIFLW